jgi:CRISPR/Cas system CSM-associated protein Csm2 small subunit
METTRAKVIEKAVGFEELISQLLSMLLDIDKDLSKSFGSQGSTLSFNAKINLLIDLKFIPAEVSKDFQLFAEIRNKFAHVLYVDTFVKCFEIIDKSRNNFLKRFSNDVSKIDKNDESIYASCFEILCFELGIWLRVTLKMISNKKSQDLNKIGAIEMMRGFLQNNNDASKSQNEWENFSKTIKPVIDKIIPDEEFLEEYKRLLKEAEEKHNEEE